MIPIVSFLQDGHLLHDAIEAKKIKKRAARFTILNDTLHKRGFSMPYLKCVDEEEAKYILEAIHKGICGDHAGPRSLVDAVEFVKKCDKCQRFENVQRLLVEKLMTIASPRPFVQWGIDIVGPFPLGKGQVRFLLVAIDYFTKWVEAEVIATITEAQIRSIVWKNIICRLDNAKGAWPEELHNVLWVYKTTARTPIGETPFGLTYGTEAVIPVEVGVANTSWEVFHEENNDDQLRINLDYLDEIRNKASDKMTKYQQKKAEYYNKRVKLRRLDIGDLVLRKVTTATRDFTQGKLGPT
ncbi:uncharacterized protein LOC142606340 [Castanea sativa]|uniref:uncharacterized protein LOC142606340 n=1 Tax=Castanea sativa TaxID=21020 RepID=UPI003F64FB52